MTGSGITGYSFHTLSMRNVITLKFIARLLLIALFTVTLNCVHESAHAIQAPASTRDTQPEFKDTSETCNCPSQPSGHPQDSDECDDCYNCACHAPSTIQIFRLNYNPVIRNLGSSDSFKHLPEVFLPKFIPPQNHA